MAQICPNIFVLIIWSPPFFILFASFLFSEVFSLCSQCVSWDSSIPRRELGYLSLSTQTQVLR